jgi:hypothetical protein
VDEEKAAVLLASLAKHFCEQHRRILGSDPDMRLADVLGHAFCHAINEQNEGKGGE